jgi:hypothetical protein
MEPFSSAFTFNSSEHHIAPSKESLKDHLECLYRSPSSWRALSHKSTPALLSTLGNGRVSSCSDEMSSGEPVHRLERQSRDGQNQAWHSPSPLTMFLMTPNRSFSHCRYSIKHKEYPDSSEGFFVEDWRKCIHVECSHEAESTQDSQRTCNYNGHSVLWKPVAKRSICQRSAWRGKSIVPCFGPTKSEHHQKSSSPGKVTKIR